MERFEEPLGGGGTPARPTKARVKTNYTKTLQE
jgi:hypothetical protein